MELRKQNAFCVYDKVPRYTEELPVDGAGAGDGAGGGTDREITGSTEYDAEVFGDEEFKYQCPACGFRFN